MLLRSSRLFVSASRSFGRASFNVARRSVATTDFNEIFERERQFEEEASQMDFSPEEIMAQPRFTPKAAKMFKTLDEEEKVKVDSIIEKTEENPFEALEFVSYALVASQLITLL